MKKFIQKAKELAGRNIRINCISPSPTDSGFMDKLKGEGQMPAEAAVRVEEFVNALEYDHEAPEIEKLAGGGYRLSARLHVENAGELLGFDVDADEEGVDTVAGLIAKRLGKVALPGTSITVGDWVLTAEQAAGRRNRITTVLAEPKAGELTSTGPEQQAEAPRISSAALASSAGAPSSAEDGRS